MNNNKCLNELIDFANRLPMNKEQKINFILGVLDQEKKNNDEIEKNKNFFKENVLSELLENTKINTPAPSPEYMKMRADDFKEDPELSMLKLVRT